MHGCAMAFARSARQMGRVIVMEKNHICKKCGGIAGWDSYFQSWICTRCGNEERKPITNYDQVISKTPEELAELFANNDCGYCRIHDFCFAKGSAMNCEDVWLDWLRQEANDETDQS